MVSRSGALCRAWRRSGARAWPQPPPESTAQPGGVDTGPGVGRGFLAPEVEQRSLAVYEEVADVAAI